MPVITKFRAPRTSALAVAEDVTPFACGGVGELPSDLPPELPPELAEYDQDLRETQGDIAFTPGVGLVPSPLAAASIQPDLTATPQPARADASFFGLPACVERVFRQRGVRSLYAWQREVLTRQDVAEGCNFVYSLPTSGGKTLVAEVVLMRTVLRRKQLAMFVLPYVAIAEEKVQSMRQFAEQLGFGVEGYYGAVGRFPPPTTPTVLVCTMEKANSLFNHLLEEGRQTDVGCVVVDELHMVGEGRRGATLELLLTKLLLKAPGAQIMGMSATVPNLEQLAQWLRASCFVSDFRPVPLVQHMVLDGAVVVDGAVTRALAAKTDNERLLELITEVAPAASVLVFCASRAQCVECARQVAECIHKRGGDFRKKTASNAAAHDLKSLEHYESVLAETMPWGVAYHHGGLLLEEREIVERGFRDKAITVVCCTSTLAAGVNLPARRVIFRTPFIGRDFLTKSKYMQMCGRAGRAGLDTEGESFMMLRTSDRTRGKLLLEQPVEPTVSQVADFDDGHGLARTILEVLCTGVCNSASDIEGFVETLLLALTAPQRAVCLKTDASDALLKLADAGLIEICSTGSACPEKDRITPTAFGHSAVKSCFSIDEALFVRDELLELQRGGLVLSDDLHVCYFLTPLQEIGEPDWNTYRDLVHRLPALRQEIARKLGVDERVIDQRASGVLSASAAVLTERGRRSMRVLKRFFSAMMLSDVLVETPLRDVEVRYQVNRGQIQALMKNAAMFSASICSFCSAMQWYSLEAVLASFVKRLGYGVRPDLVPLMEIKGVTPARARALWNAGYKTPKAVMEEQPEALKAKVRAANPESRSVKYFSIKAAAAVVREAHRLVLAHLRDKRTELEELSCRTAAPTQQR